MNNSNYVQKLKQQWTLNGLGFNPPAPPEEIDYFASSNKICLPYYFYEYFLEVNGNKGIDGLARLWSLHELTRVTDYFMPPEGKYSEKELEFFTRERWGERFMRLRQGDPHPSPIELLLPHAEDYFIFGDYNINGQFWAIRLLQDCATTGHPIVLIADASNNFRYVTGSFDDFLRLYLDDCPEALI